MHRTVGILLCLVSGASASDRRTIEFKLHGHSIQGTPLHWSSHSAKVLGRDGRVWSFSPSAATSVRPISSSFQSYPASMLQGMLQEELGHQFRVVSTRHYVVAIHRDVHTNWADRFENLYSSFERYFSVRGFHLERPEFPLVAIVWPNHQAFHRAAQADMSNYSSNVIGYYSRTTNRIHLYDEGADLVHKDKDASALRQATGNRELDRQQRWLADMRAKMWENAGKSGTESTIIHEATHQTAFNTGIHHRFGDPPRWVTEGLAMMFEARGVWDSHSYTRRIDRINRDRFTYFQKSVAPKQSPGLLESLIASDMLFSANASLAYAEAWALSFYLVETQPRKYAEYLARTNKQSGSRMHDFVAVFGGNFRLLDLKFQKFMLELE